MASQYSNHFFDVDASNNSWSNLYRYIPEGSRVLDVGCATGNFGEALENLKQCTVVGIDINAADIAEAAKKISEASVLDLTTDDANHLGKFDVIVFADVLEHMPEPRKATRAVRSLLNDGGIVIYSIPNMGHLSVRLDLLEGRFPYTELGLLDRTHLRFYDRLEIADVFSSTGFAIVKEDPVMVGNPRQFTTERLGAVGLSPDDQFFNAMTHTDADVYQFVGLAIPSDATPAIPTEHKATAPDALLDHANNILSLAEEVRAENARLQAENQQVRGELEALRHHVAMVKRNPLLWLAKRLGRAVSGR